MLIITAIVLAIVVALLENFMGIKDPWRKLIWVGIVIIFVVGLIQLLIPGLIPISTRWP